MSDLVSALTQAINLIKEDWSRLSNFLKYCYTIAFAILFATYLIKINNKELVHIIGFGLFLFFIVIMPFLNWIWVHLIRLTWYRRQYPVKEHGEEFIFVEVVGAIHIIDLKKSEIRWIENPITAYDLGYYPAAWTEAQKIHNFTEKITVNSKIIDLNKFRINRGVRTRGKPRPGVNLD